MRAGDVGVTGASRVQVVDRGGQGVQQARSGAALAGGQPVEDLLAGLGDARPLCGDEPAALGA